MNKNSIPTKEYIIYLLAVIGFITSCKKEDVNEPTNPGQTKKYHIARFDFGPNYTLHPTAEQIDSAFAAGADSVYIVSTEDWDYFIYNGNGFIPDENVFKQAYQSLVNIRRNGEKDPRLVGIRKINPDTSVVNKIPEYCKEEYRKYGFEWVPGYKPNKNLPKKTIGYNPKSYKYRSRQY